MDVIRHDWTQEEVMDLFEMPFFELGFQAQQLHRKYHDPGKIQLCTLSNIKSGGCPEDCGYCPQAARYHTGLKAQRLSPVDEVVLAAQRAKDAGASRFCMGAAWREVRDNRDFENVLEMVRKVSSLELEVCTTLGMLNRDQAKRLAEAGLTAYNHNLDTSPEFYGEVITTRTYEDRLRTIAHVRDAGITVCCGGIVGLGEGLSDRAGMLRVLANMDPHPESVPINSLVAVEGTPLAEVPQVDVLDFIRTIAVARVLMPATYVRLAAGRSALSKEGQALAFMFGANSIFYGEELLTTPNPEVHADMQLLNTLGLEKLDPQPIGVAVGQ